MAKLTFLRGSAKGGLTQGKKEAHARGVRERDGPGRIHRQTVGAPFFFIAHLKRTRRRRRTRTIVWAGTRSSVAKNLPHSATDLSCRRTTAPPPISNEQFSIPNFQSGSRVGGVQPESASVLLVPRSPSRSKQSPHNYWPVNSKIRVSGSDSFTGCSPR